MEKKDALDIELSEFEMNEMNLDQEADGLPETKMVFEDVEPESALESGEFYSDEAIGMLLDEDAISDEEEGFMRGYLEEAEEGT